MEMIREICITSVILAIVPVVGNIYIPPRSANPPKLSYGLTRIETYAVNSAPVLNVIFVHGLGSFPDTTWRKPVTASGKLVHNVSWIEHFLPSDLPQASLWYFNYDSSVYNDAPAKSLEDIADELLFNLRGLDNNIGDVLPIVFVCHSYGGLVVKEALLQAALAGSRHRNVLSKAIGLVFLGTPHFGTRYASHARAAADQFKSLGSNPDIYLPLYEDSIYLQQQHTEFMKHFLGLNIVNFFETRKTVILPYPPWRAMIVPKHSATFKAPNTENHGLDYDHSGLNKFNARDDPGYRKILFVLQTMARTVIGDRPKATQEISSVTRWVWKWLTQ